MPCHLSSAHAKRDPNMPYSACGKRCHDEQTGQSVCQAHSFAELACVMPVVVGCRTISYAGVKNTDRSCGARRPPQAAFDWRDIWEIDNADKNKW